jgi:hypothetical protein
MNLPTPRYKVELVEVKERGYTKHFYDVTDENGTTRYPGVTGKLGVINKPALVSWAAKEASNYYADRLTERLVALKGAKSPKDKKALEITAAWARTLADEAKGAHRRKTDKAADIGTRIHNKVDEYIKTGKLPELAEDEKPGFENFMGFLMKSGIEIVAGDTPLASRTHRYGGKCDAVGKRGGRLGILDWKTGSGLYPEHAFQAGGAYAHAAEETYGVEIDWAVIVRFGKTDANDFEVKEVRNLTMAFEAFATASKLSELLEEDYFLPNKAAVTEGMEQVA